MYTRFFWWKQSQSYMNKAIQTVVIWIWTSVQQKYVGICKYTIQGVLGTFKYAIKS